MKRGLKIYLGADHAGFALKEKLKEFLSKKDIYFEDLGSYDFNSKDDYPDFAFKVAKKIVGHKRSRGILICGTGTGMVIVANKIKGVRAAVGYDSYSVKMGRHDNDTNMLCLRGRKFSDSENLEFVKLFLSENFSRLKRHKRRIAKISNIERQKYR